MKKTEKYKYKMMMPPVQRRPMNYEVYSSIASLFVLIVAVASIAGQTALPLWIGVVLAIIGFAGLVVEGSLAYLRFLHT